MSSRRCGYCRSGNHRSDKCEIKRGQIESVRTHMYEEKKALLDLMVSNGLGIGALVRYTGDDNLYVVRSHDAVFDHYMNPFIENRNVKYQKSVRTYLQSYSGINHTPHLTASSEFVRYVHRPYFTMMVHPLNDLANYNYATFNMSRLPNPPLDNPERLKEGAYWSRSAEIVSPSEDTDIDPRVKFTADIQLHERLGKDDRGYGKRVSPIPRT